MQTSLCALLVIAFAGATMAFAPSTLVLGLRNSAQLCSASKGFLSARVAPEMSMGCLTEVANQVLLVAGESMAESVAVRVTVTRTRTPVARASRALATGTVTATVLSTLGWSLGARY